MSFNIKKNILAIISILNSLVFCFYLGADLVNHSSIFSVLLDLVGFMITISPFILILFDKKIKHLYYTTILFAMTGFLALTVINFVLSILGIVISLIESDEEKGVLKTVLKKHPIMAVVTIIISGMAFLNSSSLFDYLSHLDYGMEMLGELIAVIFIFFAICVCKKKNLIFSSSNKVNVRESIIVSLPFIIYIIYIASAFLAINLAEGYEFISLGNIVAIALLYIFVGVFEEFLLRGLSLNILIDKYGNNKKGIWTSVVLSSLLFGLIHFINLFTGASFEGVLIQVIAASFIGFYFSALYLRSGSVWTSAILHGLYDLAVSVPAMFYTKEVVDMATDYGEAISNYSWANVAFALVFVGLALFLLRKNKMREVIALRKGEVLANNKKDNLTKIVIIGFSFGVTITFCYSIFMSMFELDSLTKDLYKKILISNDYQEEYGLTYINGTSKYENLSDETKLLLAISNLEENDFIDGYSIEEAENNINDNPITTYIDKEVISKSVKDIFGTDKDLQYVDVNVSYKTNCSYDGSKHRYTCVTTNNGEDNGLKVYSNIKTVNLENGDYIEVEVYYLVEDTVNKIIYADSNLKTVYKYNTTIKDLVGDIEFDPTDNRNHEFWDAIKDNADNHIPTYRLKFKLNSTYTKAFFDSSEFISNSINNKIPVKEESIDDESYRYSSSKYSFDYNKKYFKVEETIESLVMEYNNRKVLEVQTIDSDKWLEKYQNNVGTHVSYGNYDYFRCGNEYLIYKGDFYLITVVSSGEGIIDNGVYQFFTTIEFK